MPSYAKLIYDGLWWSNDRVSLQKQIDNFATKVSGSVAIKLLKGNVISLGKESKNSLYDENKASFEESGGFSNQDMQDYIKENILKFDR